MRVWKKSCDTNYGDSVGLSPQFERSQNLEKGDFQSAEITSCQEHTQMAAADKPSRSRGTEIGRVLNA